MSNKSPFEIRLEVLQMAKSYFDSIQNANEALAFTAYHKATERTAEAISQWKQYVPATYSIDEVVKKATEMYAFVTKKD